MYVKFMSDTSVQKAGFSAVFMKEVDECETQNHGCEHECINTLGGYECSCHIGYELHSDKKHCEGEFKCLLLASDCLMTMPYSSLSLSLSHARCLWRCHRVSKRNDYIALLSRDVSAAQGVHLGDCRTAQA